MIPSVPFTTFRATRAIVATPDALATGAGVELLHAGGSAADAAVGANAVLAVTTQQMCGLGGDLFAVVAGAGGVPLALNASGRAGSGADPERLRSEGATRMPFRGDIRSVTVPGCVDGWLALHGRFGRLPLTDVLAPAIEYALDGFPASPLLARAAADIAGIPGADDYPAPLVAGQRVCRPGVARALRAIARGGRAAWYEGEFGDELVKLAGGEFTDTDLRRECAEWVEPARLRVWDHDLWTVPPNAQGYITLAAAWIAEHLPVPVDPADPAWPHLLIESVKQAGFDRGDVLYDGARAIDLLAPSRLEPRIANIDVRTAARIEPPAGAGGTIHLCAVDDDGLAVSLTQSNCAGFGAHIVVPLVKVFLNNRGSGFSLTHGHAAEYRPGRRPPHTLCPTVVTTPDGRVRYALGTMGADSQPMILLQLLARLLVSGAEPAEAVAAARWVLAAPSGKPFAVWHEPQRLRVRIEEHAPGSWVDGLRSRGHAVEMIEPFAYVAGHAQVVAVEDGMLAGAADPRALTGAAFGY
jgi:gamma-glutamyltranspeptidase/glutathione hydrolase